MSFLDDQATGQIGIGEKANLSTLTRRKRKRKKGQDPTGAETYSLMPQNEFSNIVSSPTDITQVGIGEKLQAQGTDASSVGNVFKDYTSAAPLGTTLEAIYYQPPPEEEEEDEDLPDIANDPMQIPSHDTGVDDPFSGNFQDHFAVDDPTVTADQSQAVPGTEGPDFFSRDDISEGQARAGMQPGSKTFSEVLAGMGKGLQSLVTTFSTPGIIADLLGDNKGGPAKPGYVPGRSRATGQPAGYQSQNFNTQGRSGMLGNTSGSSQASPPDPGGMGDDPGGGGPDAAPGPDISDMDPGLFASGGTVKAKTKKVPSFMDSK